MRINFRGNVARLPQMKTLSQSETATLAGISPRRFSHDLLTLVTQDDFPPPYIGNLENGRAGPRRRWMRDAVLQWMKSRTAQHITVTPANDLTGYRGKIESGDTQSNVTQFDRTARNRV